MTGVAQGGPRADFTRGMARVATKKPDYAAGPVLNGKIYCSPWCGGGCTLAAYQTSKKRSEQMARELGNGFIARPGENLGWFPESFHPVTGAHMHVHGKIYTLYAKYGGHQFLGQGGTPTAALKNSLKAARADFKLFEGDLAAWEHVKT